MVFRLLILLLIVIAWSPFVRAHQVETVEFEFQRLETEWRLLGEMDIAYMLPETRDLPGAQPLSREAVMKAPPEELARIRSETENTLRKLLRMTFAGQEIRWRIEFPDFKKQPFTLPEEMADWALLSVRLIVDAQPGPGDFKIHWSGEEESELIILTEDSEDGEIVSVSPGGELVLVKVEASGTATAAAPQWAFGSWVMSGYRHVLPVGLDHMLFIFGLFVMVLKWRPLMWQSLLFTIAHSITLALSVFGWLHIDQRLLEILIAFSIAFVGVENLISQRVGRLRYALVFGFGLVHGMGFASVLADKMKGVPRDQLTLPLLGFNLGVEFAQLTVLAVSFLIFLPIRSHRRAAQTVGSVIVAVSGIFWMVDRLFLL